MSKRKGNLVERFCKIIQSSKDHLDFNETLVAFIFNDDPPKGIPVGNKVRLNITLNEKGFSRLLRKFVNKEIENHIKTKMSM